ncbi:MAG: serine/threonine protein kinase [Ruminococcus sp.]|nr:serine/threonine protein kinase [Ruminococcus sp.]
MYNILKTINDSTYMVESNNHIYIAKVISLEETELYKKLMAINNPYIAKIYGFEIIDGQFCVIEEYILGSTLEEYVMENGSLDDETVKSIVTQLCSGLSEIHKTGLVHRDINPTNVMIDGYGRVKIIDFGIIRQNKANKSKDTRVLGTQGYAAPEQFGFSQTNARADIYAVGVLINYLKTGALPNERKAEGFFKRIVEKCTRIDETNRYASVDELVKDITGKNARNFFALIPGFRKGVWWHMVIATIYYFIIILGYSIILTSKEITVPYWIDVIIYPFMFFVPVPILTDFNNWTSKVKYLKYKDRSTKIATQVLLAAASWGIALGIIILGT